MELDFTEIQAILKKTTREFVGRYYPMSLVRELEKCILEKMNCLCRQYKKRGERI
jgi:hypothetical protein